MRNFRFPGFAALLLAASFFIACDNTGTTTTFTGTVTDAQTGNPIKGVSVTVMPFSLGEETGDDGTYSIELPRTTENVYLVFSIPGYDSWQTGSMPLSPKRKNLYTIDVSLEPRIAKAELSSNTVDFGAEALSVERILTNPGSDTLRWNFLELYFPEWLTVDPLDGVLVMGESQTITFHCDRTGLPIGNQSVEIQLVGGQTPLTVEVLALVEGAVLTAKNTVFEFGEEETQLQTTLSNSGNIPLEWQLEDALPAWLSWDPAANGSVPAGEERTIAIMADRSVLDFGTYSFSTKLLSNAGDTTYAFSISKTQDLIQVAPQSIDFGTQDTERSFSVSRLSGIHDVPFTVTCEDPLLSLSVAEGNITQEVNSAEIFITLDRENIPAGKSESVILVNAPDQQFSVQVTYSTAAVLPQVSTDGFELDQAYRLHFKGTLVSNGGGSVVQHGHCWGTNPNPDTENGDFSQLGSAAEGELFVSYPETLPQTGTTWYYRSYATNEMGTAYGETQTLDYMPPIMGNPVLQFDDFLKDKLIFRLNNVGGTPYSEHGFIWNNNGTVPEMNSDHVIYLGAKEEGSYFIHQMNDPERGTRYTMRGFAVNNYGISYSDTVSLYIAVKPPEITTGENVSNISYYEAVLEGNIQTVGSESILEYGHCWSITPTPDISHNRTKLGTTQDTGNYTSQATGLLINTTYYYRAYIQTALDVYYGEVYEFTTLRDDNVVAQDGLKMYITTDNTPKAYEWTGNVPDLTVSNGITYNTSNKPAGTRAAISFNGSSGYLLSRYYNPLSGADRGTFNFWLRFRNKMNKSLVYPFFGSISEGGFFVEIRHNGTNWVLTLCMGPGKDTYVIPLPSYAGMDITDFLGVSWHMMSIVSNGTAMTVYLDGMNLYTEPMEMSFGVQDDFVVGANALNGTTLNTFLPADMACLRFYDRVLNDSEIATIFNSGQ
ncbi:MAG TPA: carboxypeptidase regulatory-like domain-containing protein [Bacteroidales bacterium]|nr:carboxypeptidase regulatory-like domain-containing protein [Bacteroidales bacterium]